jgi:hypothetical protein
MRDPDRDDEPQYEGGRAAERLREFLAERFGDDAPVIPPDEEEVTDQETAEDEEAQAPADDPSASDS